MLEAVLERVKHDGLQDGHLHIMAHIARRTTTTPSATCAQHAPVGGARHLHDPKKTDRMEDLNRDGRIELGDAKLLYDEIDKMLTGRSTSDSRAAWVLSGKRGAPALRAR